MSNRPNPTPAGEQKSEKRVSDRWSVRLRCRFLSAGQIYDGLITDLSKGGAFVETEACPPADSPVNIELKLGGVALSIDGIVRHAGWFLVGLRNGNGFGVEFENLSGEANAFVSKVLSHVSDRAPEKVKLER